MSLTVHCLVKNEEVFVIQAVESVIASAEKVMIFDTGSTDETWAKIQALVVRYPEKVKAVQKGPCTPAQHTQLRQEMVNQTTSDWFMIVDGDEIWTEAGMVEVEQVMHAAQVDCALAPFYLCVGDILHHSLRGKYQYDMGKLHASPRLFRRLPDVGWNLSPYGGDYVQDKEGNLIRPGKYTLLKNRYWHCSALVRSSQDEVITLGRHKQVITYSLKFLGQGFRIWEKPPAVFAPLERWCLPIYKSWVNAVLLIAYGLKILGRRKWI